MSERDQAASVEPEWGVEVWPHAANLRRVDTYPTRDEAERLLRNSYGSHARLVCREWRPVAPADQQAGRSDPRVLALAEGADERRKVPGKPDDLDALRERGGRT